ncbi:MAG TPA: hypothetical protein VGD37_41565 [Kofleriaceae bacterium]
MIALLVACSAGAPPRRAPHGDAAMVGRPLGMNDVSILLPLPRDIGRPMIAALDARGGAVVDRRSFDTLVTVHGDIAPRTGGAITFDDFQVVAVRFDLCDRSAIGPCPPEATGRLRLVLQPLYARAGLTFAHDVALHAFYPIPAAEMSGVIDALRRLSRIRPDPRAVPLSVSPAATAGDVRYLDGLRALVLRYARAVNLVRLTVIGQVADSAAFAWIFRGLDRDGDELVPMVIPGIASTQQTVQLAGGDTVYRAAPMADFPSGFALATNGPRFRAATSGQRWSSLAALTELQNPTLHDTTDTQCIGCHLATFLTARRAAASGIQPSTLPGWFASPRAQSVHTLADADPRVVRAFGWAGNVPAISQRVANDTAQVLSEIEARFPPPRSP